MRGVIFQELKELARAKLGSHAWTNLLSDAGVETTLYSPMGSYPDLELAKLIEVFAQRLGISNNRLLEELGKFLVIRFYKSRPYLFDAKWSFLDAVEHIGDMLKQVIQVQPITDSTATEVVFKHERELPTRTTLHYKSPRMYCHLWKGAVHGFARHFGVAIEITEPICMLQGDDECEIIIDVIGPAEQGRDEFE